MSKSNTPPRRNSLDAANMECISELSITGSDRSIVLENNTEPDTLSIPSSSPPPSYEYVLEEVNIFMWNIYL